MRSMKPFPESEAKISVIAWALARGIQVREVHGWIILEMGDGKVDPLLEVMAEVLKGQT